MRRAQRKPRRFYDPIQEGKLIICEKPQVYMVYAKTQFEMYVQKVKEASRKRHEGGGGSTEILASRDLWTIPYMIS